MNPLKQTILVCDDNRDSSELLKFAFNLEGFEVVIGDDLDRCLDEAVRKNFQAIILDNRFGNLSSIDVSRHIRRIDPNVPIIFYSGEARSSEIEKALSAGANAYLIKPLDFEKLTDTVIDLIKKTGAES
jgi:DNA-binding response OmpR family regulator